MKRLSLGALVVSIFLFSIGALNYEKSVKISNETQRAIDNIARNAGPVVIITDGDTIMGYSGDTIQLIKLK
jgi:hypothetical protein